MFVLNVYLPLFVFAVYAQVFTLWMIITYLISLTENWGQLWLPLPEVIRNTLIKLRNTAERRIDIDEGLKVEKKDQIKEEE